MNQLVRGTVVHHKIMGKGIVINEVNNDKNEKMIEVRMSNGHIEKFYPEELETDDVVRSRHRQEMEEVNRVNREMAKKLDPFYNGD